MSLEVNLQVAYRSRPCRGQTRSGDAVVIRTEGETTLLAVIDALGHGPLAADAADRAVAFLRAAVVEDGLLLVMEGLHHTLRSSRGAAATVCLVGPSGLEASGVGNVTLRVFGSRMSFILTPGILGGRLRAVRVFHGALQPKARLLLHSDGVRPQFSEQDATLGSLTDCCDVILSRYGRHQDDATLMITEMP